MAKSQNVPCSPKVALMYGNNCATSQFTENNARVAKDMARPRIFVGNISDMIIHGIGPNEKAKLAIKTEIAISNPISEGIPE